MLREITQRCGVTVSSNYARKHAAEIAALSGCGLLTTRQFNRGGTFGRTWYPTARGLAILEEALWTP